jgi:hypothetical protein
MVARTTNPNHSLFKRWGGRGITVCQRWSKYDNFLADMGECPNSLTLERRNNVIGYRPSNCEWATHKTQANNTRRNHFINFQGKRRTITQWAESLGMHPDTLIRRVCIYKWPIKRALTAPLHHEIPKVIRIRFRGKRQSVEQWAEERGIPSKAIYSRIEHGWLPREVLGFAKEFGRNLSD